MNGWLIGAVTLVYAAIAIRYGFVEGKLGLAITFFGYSVANIGLIMADRLGG